MLTILGQCSSDRNLLTYGGLNEQVYCGRSGRYCDLVGRMRGLHSLPQTASLPTLRSRGRTKEISRLRKEPCIYSIRRSFRSTSPKRTWTSLIDPKLASTGANAAKNIKITYNYDFLAFLVEYFVPIIGIPNVEVTGTAVRE